MRDLPGMSGPMCDWPDVAVIEGAEETLRHLSARALCCLATSARDSEPDQISRALRRGGLERFISRLFCYRGLGVDKSSPLFYRRIIEQLECRPSEIVMVGDNLEADVLAARSAGLRAVWFNPRNLSTDESVLQIRQLAQLADLCS